MASFLGPPSESQAAVEPPCTTFSAAAHPMVRSYRQARGLNHKTTKVWVGNRLAFACLTLLSACANAGVMAILENPRSVPMVHKSAWFPEAGSKQS